MESGDKDSLMMPKETLFPIEDEKLAKHLRIGEFTDENDVNEKEKEGDE